MAALSAPVNRQRGLTLTEVAVTMILGTMIMAGLVGFYLSSQGVWLDASTQAITQREAALVTAAMRDSIRTSAFAVISAVPDPLHEQLALYRHAGDPTPSYYFWWSASDSLLYAGTSLGAPAAGPMIVSRVERFVGVATPATVRMELRLRSANGDAVEAAAFAVLQNR